MTFFFFFFLGKFSPVDRDELGKNPGRKCFSARVSFIFLTQCGTRLTGHYPLKPPSSRLPGQQKPRHPAHHNSVKSGEEEQASCPHVGAAARKSSDHHTQG